MTRDYYESDEALSTLSSWYSIYKEEAFIQCVAGLEPGRFSGLLIEVGAGVGFHGSILANASNYSYIHTDYSYVMCRAAKERGLKTIQMDGLAMPIENESVDGILAIGPSTIVGSHETRIKQFKEFYRALKPDGYLIMVTGRTAWRIRQHCLDRHDLQALLKLGFIKPKVRFWGVISGKYWGSRSCRLYEGIEKILSGIGIGVRKIVMLEK